LDRNGGARKEEKKDFKKNKFPPPWGGVAAHGEDDCDVAKPRKQTKPDDPLNIVRGIDKKAELLTSSATTVPSSRPKVVAENAPERKTLEHFVHGNHQPAKAEAYHHADKPLWGTPVNSSRTWLMA